MPLMGFTWVIGLLAVGPGRDAVAFVFIVLNSLQVSLSHHLASTLHACVYTIQCGNSKADSAYSTVHVHEFVKLSMNQAT